MVTTSAELAKVASSPFDKGYLLCATLLLELALSVDGVSGRSEAQTGVQM